MRMIQIVVGFPFFDLFTRVVHRQEPGSLQAFLSKPVVGRLEAGVIEGSFGAREVEESATQSRDAVISFLLTMLSASNSVRVKIENTDSILPRADTFGPARFD